MSRHLVQITNPRIVDRTMLVSLSVKDWNNDLCFWYPVDDIDNQFLHAHVLWKLSCYDKYVISATAEADIKQADYHDLNLHEWDFAQFTQ